MRIFVGNLPWSFKDEDLKGLFAEKGEVTDANVISDKEGRSKGFGFVEMPNDSEAKKAIKEMDGFEVADPQNPDNKRTIKVDEARPMKPRE